MGRVETSIFIAAPPAAVWAVMMNPQRLSQWVTIHRGLGKVSSGPPRPGFQMDQHLALRGAGFKVQWQLAECEHARRARWEGRGPAHARATTEYELREADAGTDVIYRNEFHTPMGMLGAIASRALIGDIPEREAARSLVLLKRLVEQEAVRR